MAIFTPGALIGGISGNVGGLNFANTRSGPVIRKALARTHKQTQPQINWRSLFSAVQRHWATLSSSSRTEWNTAATQIKLTNRLAIPKTLSGFQLFTKLNLEQNWGSPLVLHPPTILAKISSPTLVVLTASAAGNVVVNWTQPEGTAASFTYFFGARSISSRPAHHFKNWRYLMRIPTDGGPQVENITFGWNTNLGPCIEGELIAVKIGHLLESHLFSHYIQATTITLA